MMLPRRASRACFLLRRYHFVWALMMTLLAPVYPLIEALMGGATCLGEIGLRTMPPWEKEFFQGWHRGTRRLLPAAAVRLPDRSSMTQTAPTRKTTPSGWTTCR